MVNCDKALPASSRACNLEPRNRAVRLGFAHISSRIGFGSTGVPAALETTSQDIEREYYTSRREVALESFLGSPRWPRPLPRLDIDEGAAIVDGTAGG